MKKFFFSSKTAMLLLLALLLVPTASWGVNFPLQVPYFNSSNGWWANQQLGFCPGVTVKYAGCAVSSVAMVLAYHGASVDPGSLNDWLKRNGGYSGCGIIWGKAASYPPTVGYPYVNLNMRPFDWNRLRSELDNCRPVIVHIYIPNKGDHYVVVKGYSGDTFYINDSYLNKQTLAEYGATPDQMIVYYGNSCKPSCPTITFGDLTPVPCIPRNGSSVAYSAQLQASSGAAPYQYALANGALPPGLNLSADGKISGMLNAQSLGTFTFTIVTTDANGCTGSRTYTLTIEKCPCPPMKLNDIKQPVCLPQDGAGLYYQHQLTATGVTSPYTFALTKGTLPAGLKVTPDGKIAGRMSKDMEAKYTFDVTVSDSCDCSATQTYALELYSCTVKLNNWQITVNDKTYQDGEFLPTGLDDSGFDWQAGLGTLLYQFKPDAAGNYIIKATFDYLFSSLFPERFDLTAQKVGTPKENQLLDIAIEDYEVSVDLGWEFMLSAPTDYAEITFDLGSVLPDLPYVEFAFANRTDQTGYCENAFQFGSTMNPVPEPGTFMLFGLGLLGLLRLGTWRIKKK